MEQLIFLLILGALALGKYFLENAGSFGGGDSPDDTPNPGPSRRPMQPRPPASMPGGGETEEERMRRFMEALGLPPTAPPPQPKPAAQRPPEPKPAAPVPASPAQPQPRPRPIRPNPRHLGEPYGRPMVPVFRQPKPQSPAPAPIERPLVPAPEPIKTTMAAPMSETAPAMQVTSLERFPDPGLAVESAAAGVETSGRLAPTAQGSVQTGRDAAALKRDLRNPAALRRAILLREILGPPKGLQSASGPSIFHLP